GFNFFVQQLVNRHAVSIHKRLFIINDNELYSPVLAGFADHNPRSEYPLIQQKGTRSLKRALGTALAQELAPSYAVMADFDAGALERRAWQLADEKFQLTAGNRGIFNRNPLVNHLKLEKRLAG